MSLGIRAQIVALVSAVVALSLTLAGWAVVTRQGAAQMQEMRARSVQMLQALGLIVAVEVANNDVEALDNLAAQIQQSGHGIGIQRFAVLDHQGRVLAHTDPQEFNRIYTDPFTLRALASREPVLEREGERLHVAVPAVSGIRWATLEAEVDLGEMLSLIALRRQSMIAAVAVVILLLVAMLYVGLSRTVIAPLAALRRMAEAVEKGDFSQRVQGVGKNEIGQLGETFNRMAVSLKIHTEHLSEMVAERTKALTSANQRLEKLAVTDGLTGLYNHRHFQESLSQEAKRSSRSGKPFSIIMIDVDLFKKYNDAHGHPAGDLLLRSIAVLLEGQLRSTDLLARYGGEEFVAILPETSSEAALAVADKLRQAVEVGLNEEVPARALGRVTVSLGVATYPDNGAGPQAVLQAADQALYAAKNRGRNRVVAAPSAQVQSA